MSQNTGCWVCVFLATAAVVVPSVILGLAFSPYSFHPRVDSAILAAFDTSSPPPKSTIALHYNLSVDLSFRNSHRHLKFRHLDVAATAFYGDFMLGFPNTTFLTPFSQGPKNTTVLHTAFQNTVAVFPSVAAEVKRERAAGLVHLRVRLSMKLRITAWGINRPVHRYTYDCWLWFQPAPTAAVPAVFDAGTRCWPVK